MHKRLLYQLSLSESLVAKGCLVIALLWSVANLEAIILIEKSIWKLYHSSIYNIVIQRTHFVGLGLKN